MKDFVVTALKVLGWLGLLLVVAAASSTSVFYAYRYGLSLAAAEAIPERTGIALALVDVVKIAMLAIAVAVFEAGQRKLAYALGGVFSILICLSLWATISITAIERAGSDAKIAGASKAEVDLRAEMATVDARIKELGSPLPQKAVEAQLDGFKSDERWRTTASCNPLNITAPGSRKFCGEMAMKQAAIAEAAEADKLRTRNAEIRQQLATLAPESAKVASPELTLIANLFGWRPESVGLGRAIAFAIGIELLGALTPTAVWLLRPSLSTSAPVHTPIQKPVARSAAVSSSAPRSPGPAPTRLPAPKRTSGPRRRRRDNLIDFAEAFAERNGRLPTMPEVKQQFPRAKPTTTWRAIQDAKVTFQNSIQGNAMTA